MVNCLFSFSFESLNKKFFDLKYTKSDTGEFGNCLIKKHYKKSSRSIFIFIFLEKKIIFLNSVTHQMKILFGILF